MDRRYYMLLGFMYEALRVISKRNRALFEDLLGVFNVDAGRVRSVKINDEELASALRAIRQFKRIEETLERIRKKGRERYETGNP